MASWEHDKEIPTRWRFHFDNHQLMQMKWAWLYASDFKHRTPGASDLTLIALLGDMLLDAQNVINDLERQLAGDHSIETPPAQ